MWSVDDLDRNISTQYYERRLAAQRESSTLPVPYTGQADPLEYIKNPMVAEFMGFHRDTNSSESALEQALIDNLEKFIMELGRGFAFVDFYIDLVFYNYGNNKKVLQSLSSNFSFTLLVVSFRMPKISLCCINVIYLKSLFIHVSRRFRNVALPENFNGII